VIGACSPVGIGIWPADSQFTKSLLRLIRISLVLHGTPGSTHEGRPACRSDSAWLAPASWTAVTQHRGVTALVWATRARERNAFHAQRDAKAATPLRSVAAVQNLTATRHVVQRAPAPRIELETVQADCSATAASRTEFLQKPTKGTKTSSPLR